jgi:hypothetical protein
MNIQQRMLLAIRFDKINGINWINKMLNPSDFIL